MRRTLVGALSLAALLSTPGVAEAQTQTPSVETSADIIVTARKREENLQDVPIAITALSGEALDRSGVFSVAQVAQMQPSLQFVSSNPRNTALNIRGLGSNFGLANDGLEQGVGYYVDDVYFARPASAVIDLIDVERVEVLRGPQGTLFGKNTTAGALNVTTRAPSFTPEGRFEASAGDYGFLQVKATVSGPLSDRAAGRISLGATDRDGFVRNTTLGRDQNDFNNRTVRGQVLFAATPDLNLRLSADYSEQETECCTQAFVRYGATLRAPEQQFPALAEAFGYAPASLDPFDRLVDVNSPLQANQTLSGASIRADWDFGEATLTSISAIRNWRWRPANDRDYMALSVRTASNNPSNQDQVSQEIRIASNGEQRIDWVFGLYAFSQSIITNGREEWGADAARWLIGPSVPSNLLDGYLATTHVVSETDSYAAFGQLTWNVTDRLRISPGVRYTLEEKSGSFDQFVSGGLSTTDPALIARQLAIARPQSYDAAFTDESPSGQINIAYDVTPDILAYVTLARGFKSGGINAAGIPTDSAGAPALVSAVIQPEKTTTAELGLKTQWLDRTLTLNLAAYTTEVTDYQANVVDTGPGALRGYLANIDSVEVRGVELEARYAPDAYFIGYATLAWTDAEYASFPNGPCPLELIGASTAACNLSGRRLPGVSEWAASLGGEFSLPASFAALDGEVVLGGDVAYRSDWNSDASVSRYAEIDASTIVNVRLGYRVADGAEAFFWVRNALDEDYLTLISVQAGNSGALYGQIGDPRTFGVTLRRSF